jgi:hypothetical protein
MSTLCYHCCQDATGHTVGRHREFPRTIIGAMQCRYGFQCMMCSQTWFGGRGQNCRSIRPFSRFERGKDELGPDKWLVSNEATLLWGRWHTDAVSVLCVCQSQDFLALRLRETIHTPADARLCRLGLLHQFRFVNHNSLAICMDDPRVLGQ